MAGIFDFLNAGGKNKDEEKFQKNAQKVQDFIDKYKIRSRDLNVPEDHKKDTGAYNPGFQSYAWVDEAITTSSNRATRYKDYREMTNVPELNQSLNIYADNATQYNVQGNVLEIHSNNNKIVETLEKCFFDNLDINSRLWSIVRNTCKLGDEFVEVVVDNPENPKHIISLERIGTPENMKRVEKDGALINFRYEYDDDDKEPKLFQPWQVVHFSIEDEEYDPYGKSILESGRKTFKKLTLMEDAMLVYRISRAPERRVFYIDVGTLPTKEADKFIETLKRQFRKKKYINPQTGEVDEKANPLCVTLDTKIPLLDGRSLELRDLIQEYKNGKENWVYSIDIDDNNQIVPGKIIWADVTRKDAELMKITLDNGKELRVTPDHKFMMRDGSYAEAKDLKENDSLMPLYTKLSSKKDGDRIEGYEKIYNPATMKYEYTHRVVAETIHFDEWNIIKKGRTTHHKDFNKLNNSPNNLDVMNIWEHRNLHINILEKTLLRDDVIEKNRKRITEYNYSEQHKINVSNANKKRNSIQAMSWYNNSDLHKEHNVIRSENLKKQFYDPESRQKYIDGMTISNKITDKFWSLLKEVAQNTELNSKGYISITNVLENACLDEELMAEWKTFCKPNKQSSGPNRHFIIKALREIGYESSEQWLNECEVPTKNNRYEYQNHKVVKVEWLDYVEDTGDITIDTYHNFATEAGVFIHNSVDEDFYIPVRQNSQGTRIETLPAGQNLGEIDDVKYFKDQILRTMGIPSGYLGGGAAAEGAGTYDPKSYLSNQEIQFARTIERVQKFIIKGLEKIAFIELILSKTDRKEIKDFQIKLTPPSNVDQLMEIEIRNQQFALIQQIRTLENFLPDEWIYSEVLGMSEQEIQKIRLQLQMQQQMQLQLQNLAASAGGGGMNMGTGGELGGNIVGGGAPGGEAGGPPEAPAPEGGGGEEGGGEAGLEVAGNTIEFDGGHWMMENTEDIKKLLKYLKLYEKVHKDNNTNAKVYEQNSATRMLIEGEFRGLVKAYQSSDDIVLKEENIRFARKKRKRRKKSS